MSCQQEIIKKFCSSHLDHKVHIPKIRSTLYVESSKISQELHENPSIDTLHVYAKKYSIILKDQIESIEQYYGPEATKERHLYQQLERVWALCQILYFPEPNNVDTKILLMDWYSNAYKPYLFEFDRQSIFFCKSTFDHPDFWPYVIRLILFGQLEQLSTLFSHVLTDTEFQLHWGLLECMKDLQASTSQDVQYLKSQRTHMQQLLLDLCQIQNSPHVHNLRDVISLLMGDENVTLQYAKDDIQAFISSKFYQIDDNSKTIHEAAKEFFEKHGNGDACIRLFLEGSIYEAFEISADYDWWFIAHLADLLSLKNKLNRSLYYSIQGGATLTMGAREYFILTYASYLNNQFGLWEESFTYLMTCGDIGKDAVIEHLKNMDFQNDDKKLNDVVNFCIDYSMKNDGLVLYEKKASSCLELKEYKKALQYYSQAGKDQYLDQVFNAVLEDFIYTGQLYDIQSFSDTNDYNGIHYLVYRDISYINALFSIEQYQEAANIFKTLIEYDSIPKLIMPVIFAEGWKIIDRRVNFNLNDLLEMKNMCIELRESYRPQDFKWYHYYICNEYNDDEKDKDIPHDILLRDMAEFFDTTAIIVTRAIDVFEKS